MTTPAQSNSNQAFDPVRPQDLEVMLQSAIPTKARLQVWTSGQKFQFVSRVTKVLESHGLHFISVSKEEGGVKFEKDVTSAGITDFLFTLNLPTEVLFFKGEMRKGETANMNFKVEKVFKVQRRTSLRLPLSASQTTVCTMHLIDDAVVFGAPINISDGGMGVYLDAESDFTLLSSVKKIKRLEVVVNGIIIHTEAEVRHSQVLQQTLNKVTYKIGIQFLKLDPKIQDRLRNYIFEESSKFLGRI